MKKTLVISIVVLMMAALGASVVAAQEPGNGGRFGNRGPHEGGVMEVVSEAIGLTPQEIVEALQADGATLASVIEANGGDVDAIRATLIENATVRFEEQAANLETRIDDLLNGEFAGGRGPGGFGGGERLDNLAEVLGVEVDALRESLADGMTIAEVAEANGVDVQTVIDALVSAAEARIDEAVAADRLSAEDGEERKAELAERISDFVNNTGDHLLGGGRFGGPRGNRGPGGRGPNNDA
jgi:uncharacterized protein (DUF433 family)